MDTEGRAIVLHCLIQGQPFVFINTYVPNTETSQVLFLEKIYKDMVQTLIQESVPIIWGGDFNLPMSIEDTDKTSFNLKKKSIASLKI